jgi:hypothetical protein
MSLTFDNQCQSLSVLSEKEIIELRNEKGRVYFKDLKVLRCGYNLSNDILFDLLSIPLLESVDIDFCDALTDNLLQNVMANGFLKNLKLLRLQSCHLVTKQGLDELAIKDNILKKIRIYFCEKLTGDNVFEWHKIACDQNWELNIDFKSFGSNEHININV